MSHDLLQNLAKYRIDGLIGQGAMGAVYKGFDEDIARPVALKVLHRHLAEGESSGEMAARFRQEARAAARCLHPNIVTIFDYGTSDGYHYIAMEFIHGNDLRSLLKLVRRLPCNQAVEVIRQVLAALEYAHENGVVHRDVKPANIMLQLNGSVKVADFGIAKLDTSEMTNPGIVIGTPSYMSPEARQGLAVDFKSDLYGAGIVFYEMLTGMRPAPGKQILETLRADLLAAVGDERAIEKLYNLLRLVLDAQRETRIPSAREFLKALEAIVLPEGEDASTRTIVQTVINSGLKPITPTSPEAPAEASNTHEFSASVIERVLHNLTPYLGPLAERVVRRCAQNCSTVTELVNELAAHIPNQGQQQKFLAILAAQKLELLDAGSSKTPISSATPASRTTAPATPLELSDEIVIAVNKLLAEYLGPLATHISRRARARSASPHEFGKQLAAEIPSERERTAFLKKFQTLIP